jgi:signal transduction histidine kinase
MLVRWRGLRLRVALLTTLVACASIAAVAWYAARVSADAWRRQLRPTPPAAMREMAASIAEAAQQGGSVDWARAQRTLSKRASETGKQLIVFDSTRRPVVAAPPDLLEREVSLGLDGTVSWQRTLETDAPPDAMSAARAARAIVRQRIIVGNARDAAIRDGNGHAFATLVEIAAPLSLDTAGDPLILGMLRRPLIVGVIVAIAGAIVVALLLSAKLAAPVEQLTFAARSVAAGERTTRVPVVTSGSAEVAALSEAFNTMVRELDRQDSLRRGMTSDIAHELRTPLTNIRCQLESVIDGLEQPSIATLESIHSECLGLQRLIDDLQDIAYGDQGRLTLDMESVDARAEIDTIVRAFSQQAASADTTIQVDVPLGTRVTTDRRRFKQVVSNLLSNALTYTQRGCVRISATRDGDRFVAFEVRDTGAGIPEADLPNVFERFYRADPARARVGGGAGLGLAIVKQLVELHGGRISISSEAGKGTTARFTVPV